MNNLFVVLILILGFITVNGYAVEGADSKSNTLATIHSLLLLDDINPLLENEPEPLVGWGIKNSSETYMGLAGAIAGLPNTQIQNACEKGGYGEGTEIGFACPHQLLLSPDMVLAAQADGITWARYAIAGFTTTESCGKCYQLIIKEPNDAGNQDRPIPEIPYLIIQAFNSGHDVGNAQFDIYLGAGGLGLFNACSSDCNTSVCDSNQACEGGQYAGLFSDWTLDLNLGGGVCFNGGLSAANVESSGITIEKACFNAAPEDTWSAKTMRHACIQANNQGYHRNWKVDYAEVQCPENLTKATGLERVDNESRGLPLPSASLLLSSSGVTTTMQDCCKPSCAWGDTGGKEIYDTELRGTYTCGVDGKPIFAKEYQRPFCSWNNCMSPGNPFPGWCHNSKSNCISCGNGSKWCE